MERMERVPGTARVLSNDNVDTGTGIYACGDMSTKKVISSRIRRAFSVLALNKRFATAYQVVRISVNMLGGGCLL
jgi:hypothetical protein